MIEVICLFSLVLDCFYICYWFLPLELSSFGLRLKGSTFFIYYALHENYGCICLLESARTPLTNLSPWNKIWNVALIGFFFFVYFFVLRSHFSSILCGYFEYFQPCLRHWSMELENGFLMLSKLNIQIWKKKTSSRVSRTTIVPRGRLFGIGQSIHYWRMKGRKEGTSTKDGRFTNLYWPRNFSHSTGILRISKAPQHRDLTRWPFLRRRVLANIAFGFHIGTVSEFGLLLFHCSWKFWDILLRSSDCHIEIRKSIRNV